MPGDIARLVIEIDSNGVVTGKARLDDLTDAGERSENQNKKHRASFTELNQSLELGRKAFDLLKGAVVESVAEFVEAERAQVKLESILRATGETAGRTAQDLNNMANSLAGKTIFDDDSITNAQALMLTFKGIKGAIYDQTIPAVLDLSAAFGMDLAGASVMLGKALEDPTSGLTALRRVGVSFTDQQQEEIKALTEAGEAAKAQGEILDVLKGQVGGVAEAMGASASGSIARMENAVKNLQEAFGRLVATNFQPMITGITNVIDVMSGNRVDLLWTPVMSGKNDKTVGVNHKEGMAGWTRDSVSELNVDQLKSLTDQISKIMDHTYGPLDNETIVKNVYGLEFKKLLGVIQGRLTALEHSWTAHGKGTSLLGSEDTLKVESTGGIWSGNPTPEPGADSGFRASSEEYQNNVVLRDFRAQASNKSWTSPTPEPSSDSGFRAESRGNSDPSSLGTPSHVKEMIKGFQDAQAQAESFNETMKKLDATMQSIAANGIAQGFQDIGAAMASGADAGDAFGQAMVKMGVQVAEQIGGLLIADGLMLLLKSMGTDPMGWAMIAAGGGMEFAGGAIGSISKQVSGSTTSVNDAIITKDGQVIQTHPDDNLYAFKSLGGGAKGGGSGPANVTVHNYSGAQVQTRETIGPNGKELQLIIGQAVNSHLANGGADRVLGSRFGIRNPGRSAS